MALKQKTFAHFRAGDVRKDEKSGLRIVPGMASTGAIDRYNEIIKPEGWEIDNFLKNNVLLWAHQSLIPPIGSVPKIEATKDGLPFEAMETATTNEFAVMIFDYLEAKELKTFSVGFIPLDVDYHDKDRDDPLYGVIEWVRSELLEISVVPVPANPEALQMFFKMGLNEPAPFEPARTVAYDEGTRLESAIKAFQTFIAKKEDLKDAHKELLRETLNSLTKMVGSEPKGGEIETANYEALNDEINRLSQERYMLLQYAQIANKLLKMRKAPKR